jgi:hypothetical protein
MPGSVSFTLSVAISPSPIDVASRRALSAARRASCAVGSWAGRDVKRAMFKACLRGRG